MIGILIAIGLLLAIAIPAAAITYGTPDTTHPYVGLVGFFDEGGKWIWRCSGTLITETVFLTAGHCSSPDGADVPAFARVWFTEPGEGVGLEPILQDYPDLECYEADPDGRAWTGYPCVSDFSFGRLLLFKGLETLVRAMAGVVDATLLIVGPSLVVPPRGDSATHLLAVAEGLGVKDRVRWVGSVPPQRALEILAGADVVAVPSRLESLNKVCVEAASVGTPFVVTRTTGISAWVPDQGVGIVVPPEDPGALAEALTRVVTRQWQPDAHQGAAFVRQFSPRVVAAQVVGIYESVLAERPRRDARVS